MAPPKINDPVSFLTSLVTKRGKSELYGVYLTGVSVLADAAQDYQYKVSLESTLSEVTRTFHQDEADWNHLLVETRRSHEDIIHPISFIQIGRAHV